VLSDACASALLRRALDDAPAPYPVVIDPGVEALLEQARAERAG
jgi:hypothetical protein